MRSALTRFPASLAKRRFASQTTPPSDNMGMILGKIDVETPHHVVLRSTDLYQIREYPGAVVACTYSGDYNGLHGREFMNAGFRNLASYIGVFTTPQNVAQAPIAMTAPVVMTEKKPQAIAMTAPVLEKDAGERGEMMAFILPKEFNMDNAPQPTNPKVKIEQLPPRVIAVHTFSGSHDLDSCKPIAKQLVSTLLKDGIKVKDESLWEAAMYNPPWTLPWLKTNEVYVPLADGQNFQS